MMKMTEAQLKAALTKGLGLAPDTDDQAVLDALDARLTSNAQHAVSAAVSSGRIAAAHKDFWLDAFKRDYTNTHAVLASLAGPSRRPSAANATVSVADTPVVAPLVSAPTPLTVDQQRLEDAEFVDAAILVGKITQSERASWLSAMSSNREAAKASIRSKASAAKTTDADPGYQQWKGL